MNFKSKFDKYFSCISIVFLCQVLTIFNCAPTFSNLDPDFKVYTDILVVNESEAEALVGFDVGTKEHAVKACEELLAQNGYNIGVIVTLGENGCVLGDRFKDAVDRVRHFPAKKINAVDSIVSYFWFI